MLSATYDNIMRDPENYIGQTFKVSGAYSAFFWEQSGRYHHFVMVKGDEGCCPGAFEVIWSGNRSYPDDYPYEQAKIEVTGVFSSYKVQGNTLYYLAVDE
jgi:hypothetical protein